MKTTNKLTKKQLGQLADEYLKGEVKDKHGDTIEIEIVIETLKEHFNEPEKVLALAAQEALTIQEAIDSVVENNDMFEIGNREFYVLTDDEADKKNDESIENYIDECILPDLPERYRFYFDNEAFKRDARTDGRGHNLAGYDGNENKKNVNGTTYYIYRWN